MLAKTTDVTLEHLYEFATDRNASHVARRLLCVIAGHDVMPAQHNSSSMDASAVKANKVLDTIYPQQPLMYSCVIALSRPRSMPITVNLRQGEPSSSNSIHVQLAYQAQLLQVVCRVHMTQFMQSV